MSVYVRAMAYFAPDKRWMAALVSLIGVSVGVGLLEAWPFAVLIDSVLTQQPKGLEAPAPPGPALTRWGLSHGWDLLALQVSSPSSPSTSGFSASVSDGGSSVPSTSGFLAVRGDFRAC